MATDRTNIGYKFENGDIPTGADFQEVFKSFVHIDEDKADFQMVETGTDDQHYVTPALLRAGLQNIGIITGNSYMPLKEHFDSFVGNTITLQYSPINFSVKVFKNGQLLLEREGEGNDGDYIINYEMAKITFSGNIDNRNIEVDYWYKNLTPNPGGGGSGEQIDFTSFLHTSGNETKNGILTFNNTTPTSTSGIVLTNSGDVASKVLDVTVSGAGSGIAVQNTAAGTGIKVSNTGAGAGLQVNSSSTATGNPLQVSKDNIVKAKIDAEGIVTAKRFVSEGGTAEKFVKGDGSFDDKVYAEDTKVIHTSGNETKDGALKLTHNTSVDDVLTIEKNNSANCLKLVQNSSSSATTSTFDTSTENVNRKAISVQKIQVEKAFITHDGNVSGTSFTTLNEKADITDGFLTLAASDSATAMAGHAKLYAKTDGTTDLYVMGSDGVEKKIGENGGDLSAYAKIDSPSFIGVPTAPTAAVGTNTNQLATTAFVLANASPSIPHLEYDNSNKTVWNNGQGNISTNLAFGENVLSSNTTGNVNTGIGQQSLLNNTTGLSNTAVGWSSLRNVESGSENTAIGSNSLSQCKGNKNTAIGKAAGTYLSTGSDNIFIGRETGSGITTGSGNVIIGYTATNATDLTNNIIIANGVGQQKARHDGTNWTLSGNVTGNSFIKTGGTASQFLKADGSLDSNSYISAASPALTGVPTAPTAALGTNTTQIATTAFVKNEISNGTYTPTVTNGPNVTEALLTRASYTRVGNTITVSISASATYNGNNSFGNIVVTLPQNRATAQILDVGSGVASEIGTVSSYLPVYCQSQNNNSVNLVFKPGSVVTSKFQIAAVFQYSILE
ncbi:hypothetical protein BB050_00571 [Flavobacterium anhuiense]|uniref:Uncharacterized protein n=1 Tax=Flavobacterium anhuiense TaxID=459526 RepID=A0AAC9CXL4_9FLAO|nr:hypothetical protein [Flavobacterium anhuiense]AOC93725.1 hypothetical protein BB050_00571 [Flavobacterium anhuiense]